MSFPIGLPCLRNSIRLPIYFSTSSIKRLLPDNWPRCTACLMRVHSASGIDPLTHSLYRLARSSSRKPNPAQHGSKSIQSTGVFPPSDYNSTICNLQAHLRCQLEQTSVLSIEYTPKGIHLYQWGLICNAHPRGYRFVFPPCLCIGSVNQKVVSLARPDFQCCHMDQREGEHDSSLGNKSKSYIVMLSPIPFGFQYSKGSLLRLQRPPACCGHVE